MTEPQESVNSDSTPGADFTSDAYARARRWQILWPQVIALAWTDPEFKKKLRANPEETIKESFGYELSSELKLTILEAPDEEPYRFEPYVYKEAIANPDLTSPFKDSWRGLPPMELTLYIPPAPDVKDQAIAVTAYSDTGRTYPMTSG